MTTEWNVRVPMRDGTLLSADVWRGADGGRRTTLVARTPYNKNTAEQQERAAAYVAHGYNFVDMDVRGRGDSDGSFEPWRSEGRDGYDTIEWIAGQDWSDGNVVTWGQSYLGCIQWMTALEQPPHLRAMIVYVAPSDPFEDNPTGVPIPWEICWFRMLDGRVRQFVDLVDWPQVACSRRGTGSGSKSAPAPSLNMIAISIPERISQLRLNTRKRSTRSGTLATTPPTWSCRRSRPAAERDDSGQVAGSERAHSPGTQRRARSGRSS